MAQDELRHKRPVCWHKMSYVIRGLYGGTILGYVIRGLYDGTR